jgi:DNA-binding IscR family transcriptional regulator
MQQLFASERKQATYEFLVSKRDQYNTIRITYRELAEVSGSTMTYAHKMVKQLQRDGFVNIINSASGGGTLLEVWKPEERKIS